MAATVAGGSEASSFSDAVSLAAVPSLAGVVTVATRSKLPACASVVVSDTVTLAPLASAPRLQITFGAL